MDDPLCRGYVKNFCNADIQSLSAKNEWVYSWDYTTIEHPREITLEYLKSLYDALENNTRVQVMENGY